MRLDPQSGERIDRAKPVSFTFHGKTVQGFEGDTIGSALYASGQRVFSRSFKYHRPRGLACCSGHCANCQMTVDGIPSVRVCTEPLREGAVVKGQNYVGSLTRDLMQVTDKLGGPFTPPGFYYKTFIRPRKLWPLYEKILRGAAGLGPLDPNGSRQERIDVEHRHVDVVVIGGGQAGLEAAIGGRRGRRVGRRDRRGLRRRRRAARRPGRDRHGGGASRAARVAAGVELLAPAIAIGLFEQGLVPVAYGNLLLKFRAHRVDRRERDRRAAARLPGQRPRRRDAAGRRPPARQRVLDQAGRARRRAHGRRPRPRRRCRSRGRRRRDRPRRRLPRGRQPGDRGAGQGRQGGAGLDRRPPREGRPGRDVRQPAAELQAPRPGRRARRVRRGPRRLRPDRPARPRRGRRRRHAATSASRRCRARSSTTAATSASSASARTRRRRT